MHNTGINTIFFKKRRKNTLVFKPSQMPTSMKTEKKRWEPQDIRFLKHHGNPEYGIS